jgi:hypothetical protein
MVGGWWLSEGLAMVWNLGDAPPRPLKSKPYLYLCRLIATMCLRSNRNLSKICLDLSNIYLYLFNTCPCLTILWTAAFAVEASLYIKTCPSRVSHEAVTTSPPVGCWPTKSPGPVSKTSSWRVEQQNIDNEFSCWPTDDFFSERLSVGRVSRGPTQFWRSRYR